MGEICIFVKRLYELKLDRIDDQVLRIGGQVSPSLFVICTVFLAECSIGIAFPFFIVTHDIDVFIPTTAI